MKRLHPPVSPVVQGFAANVHRLDARGCARYFPWIGLFSEHPYRIRNRAVIPVIRCASTHGTGFENRYNGVTKMEKWIVVTGIWMMFASCMVLFIRGATGGPRRDLVTIEAQDDEREGKQSESFRG